MGVEGMRRAWAPGDAPARCGRGRGFARGMREEQSGCRMRGGGEAQTPRGIERDAIEDAESQARFVPTSDLPRAPPGLPPRAPSRRSSVAKDRDPAPEDRATRDGRAHARTRAASTTEQKISFPPRPPRRGGARQGARQSRGSPSNLRRKRPQHRVRTRASPRARNWFRARGRTEDRRRPPRTPRASSLGSPAKRSRGRGQNRALYFFDGLAQRFEERGAGQGMGKAGTAEGRSAVPAGSSGLPASHARPARGQQGEGGGSRRFHVRRLATGKKSAPEAIESSISRPHAGLPHVLFLFYIFHAGTVKEKEHKKNKPLTEQNRAKQPAQSPEKTSPWIGEPNRNACAFRGQCGLPALPHTMTLVYTLSSPSLRRMTPSCARIGMNQLERTNWQEPRSIPR